MGDSFFSLQYQIDNVQPVFLGMVAVGIYKSRKSKIFPQLVAFAAALYFGGVYRCQIYGELGIHRFC